MANASTRRPRRAAAFALLVAGLGLCAGRLVGQQPLPAPPQPLQAKPPAGTASPVVAYIHGTVPVTQEEFGKYLIDRGGSDKLELFVNKLIIEDAARRANVTVTKTEMEASLQEDIATASQSGAITKDDFIKVVLAKHGKTYYEWMEDVVRPRLLLQKMCYTRVKVTDAELRLQFERRFGEQRQVQIILYPLGDPVKVIQEQWGKIRTDAAEFDSVARAQANPSLAATKGVIKPITRHLIAEDKIVEKTAFALKEGEVSEVLQTRQGYLVMKLLKAIPANAAVDFEKEKPVLQKAAYDEMLEQEIPKFFGELRAAAKVSLTYTPPAEWRTVAPSTTPSVIPSGPAGVTPAGAQQPTGR